MGAKSTRGKLGLQGEGRACEKRVGPARRESGLREVRSARSRVYKRKLVYEKLIYERNKQLPRNFLPDKTRLRLSSD